LTRAIDTSVAVKWFVAEEDQDKAERLIGQPLVAPDLFLAEVSNVAWLKWRKKEIGIEQAIAGQQLAMSLVRIVASRAFAPRALEIAIELDHPVYDCFFLALCESMEITLITADKRLIARCAGTEFAGLLELLR
jgi:predicted nucleic acid-binding protein